MSGTLYAPRSLLAERYEGIISLRMNELMFESEAYLRMALWKDKKVSHHRDIYIAPVVLDDSLGQDRNLLHFTKKDSLFSLDQIFEITDLRVDAAD